MKTTDRINALVLARRPDLGKRGVKRDIANTCGISYEAVRQWFAGDTGSIKNENLAALADGYDTTVDWLLSGKGEPPRKKQSADATATTGAGAKVLEMLQKHGKLSEEKQRLLEQAVADTLSDTAPVPTSGGNVIYADFSRPGQVGDEVWIAHYDVRGAMGGGQLPHDYPEILQDVRVSPKHLREMGVEFKEYFHLKIVTGWGQSMAPTIKHRDPLLVDASIREFVGDGIYLFTHGDHLYIKRLQMKGDEHFKMISDNRHHDPEEIRVEETYIHARVLLVWNAQLL